MPSSARAAAPACRRAGALEVRYRAAVGVGEEAHSRQRHWCPWSKSVNVETWGHVPDPIVMAHTFAELGKGTRARARDNRFKSGRNLGHTLYSAIQRYTPYSYTHRYTLCNLCNTPLIKPGQSTAHPPRTPGSERSEPVSCVGTTRRHSGCPQRTKASSSRVTGYLGPLFPNQRTLDV